MRGVVLLALVSHQHRFYALSGPYVMQLPRENALFAIPKKGRLFEKCNKLLEGAGLEYVRPNRLDVATCKDLPITIVFLPAADIAKYVAKGNVDIGITGQDVVAESDVEVEEGV